MTTTTTSATVSAPIDAVWAVVADHEGMAAWAPGLKVTLDKAGAPDRNGLGAVRRIKAPGPMPAIVERIVAFEPGRRLGYEAISGVPLKAYGGEIRLSPAGTGTRIDYSVSYTPRVPLVEKGVAAAIARGLLTGLVRATKRA